MYILPTQCTYRFIHIRFKMNICTATPLKFSHRGTFGVYRRSSFIYSLHMVYKDSTIDMTGLIPKSYLDAWPYIYSAWPYIY